LDSQKRHAGYDIQVAQRLSDLAFHQPNRVTYVCVTTTSRIPTLQSGHVDMIIATLSWTKARAKEIRYSTPYFEETGRLLVRTGSGSESLADLRGKSVVTTHGSVYVTWAGACLKGTTLQQVDGTSTAVSDVAGGEASGFLYDDEFLEGVVATNSVLTLTSDNFLRIPWGIGVRKNETTLRTWIDAALSQMKAADQLYNLATSSGLSDAAHKVPRPQVAIRYPLHNDPLTNCGTD
jgi:polar amino acid transport system substrate-binding protein